MGADLLKCTVPCKMWVPKASARHSRPLSTAATRRSRELELTALPCPRVMVGVAGVW